MLWFKEGKKVGTCVGGNSAVNEASVPSHQRPDRFPDKTCSSEVVKTAELDKVKVIKQDPSRRNLQGPQLTIQNNWN